MLGLMSSVLTVNTVLIGLVTGLFVYWLIQKFKYKLPPGPIALPLIGNSLQLNTSIGHKQIFEWSLKYGPVVSVYLGPEHTVFVNDIDTVNEVLLKKGADFASRAKVPSTDVFTDGGKDITFGQYGPTWKLHRRIASKALRHYMMGEALEERVHDAAVTVIDEITKQKEPIDPENYVNFIVGNLLTGLCFGGKYKFDDPELNYIIKVDDELIDLFGGVGILEDLIPGLQYVWETGKMKRLKAASKTMIADYIGGKFLEHKASFDKGNIRDFADTLILARQEAEEDPNDTTVEKLSDTYLIQTLADIFFAGVDTSRLTLRWALYHMAAYPEIQAKVQEEIDNVVENPIDYGTVRSLTRPDDANLYEGTYCSLFRPLSVMIYTGTLPKYTGEHGDFPDHTGFNDLPRISHRPSLGYTEAALHESMRLSSVVPTGVAHYTMCDSSISGYDIPKNTNVFINHWGLHHDPRKWEKSDDFIPERYLDKDGKLGPKPENWLPFSAGRRVCLGEMVAKPELHLIFACLMQRFSWRLPDGEKADFTPDGNMFFLYPKPHTLIVEDRKPK